LEVRNILANTGNLPKIYGQSHPKQDEIAQLDTFENGMSA
jgi:5,10-methylenetetrahydrofolate reductase